MNFIESVQKPKNGRLSGAGHTNQRKRLACWNGKRNIIKDNPLILLIELVVIGEPNILEFNLTPINFGINSIGIILNGLINFEDLKHKFHIGPALSDKSPESTNKVKWEVNLQDVDIKCDKVRNFQIACKNVLICE